MKERARLGLDEHRTVGLVLAGGFGLASVEKTRGVLAETAADVQFVTITGRNEKLHRRVSKVALAHPGKIVPLGFVNNIHEYMAASDFVVTKSGGLTSSECLAMGLPMVVYNPIPGQEERNADYLLENGAAVRANSPAHLVFKVRRLLEHPERVDAMRKAALAIASPDAAETIARKVVEGV